uniref:G domain-containing protein n=1 Tax=Acrobeloides nanus TaxID=290746 RepID=A0A914C7U9_9BILA
MRKKSVYLSDNIFIYDIIDCSFDHYFFEFEKNIDAVPKRKSNIDLSEFLKAISEQLLKELNEIQTKQNEIQTRFFNETKTGSNSVADINNELVQLKDQNTKVYKQTMEMNKKFDQFMNQYLSNQKGNFNQLTHSNKDETPISFVAPIRKGSSTDISQLFSNTKSNEYNILMFGERGIGKTTFINAFYHNVSFTSFEKANTKPPKFLIPGKFLIQKLNIEVGDTLQTSQQGTEASQVYDIMLNNKTFRFIDTPGVNDELDIDENKQILLSILNNYNNIDFICFCVAPNISRKTKSVELLSFFDT